jgi:hypothetical protein
LCVDCEAKSNGSGALIAVLGAQLGTPRGRYDEHSGKFSLSMKPGLIDQ